jgi:hypothetical protein
MIGPSQARTSGTHLVLWDSLDPSSYFNKTYFPSRGWSHFWRAAHPGQHLVAGFKKQLHVKSILVDKGPIHFLNSLADRTQIAVDLLFHHGSIHVPAYPPLQ